jgi:type IV secretory pathway TrbD component
VGFHRVSRTLLMKLGCVASALGISTGVWLVASLGVALIVAGVLALAGCLTLVDVAADDAE